MLKTTPVGGVLVLAASTVIWAIGRLARSHVRPRPLPRDEPRLLLLITLAVTAVSLAALALASASMMPLTERSDPRGAHGTTAAGRDRARGRA